MLTDGHCLYDGRRAGTGWTAVFGDLGTPKATRSTGEWVVSPDCAPPGSYRHDWAVLVLSAPPNVPAATLATVGRQDRTPERAVTTVTELVTGRGHS